jgi:hypothetical protein
MEAYSHREDQKVRVSIEASDFTCEGLVHLPGIRLSDVMNEKSDFMVLVDALVFRKRTGTAEQQPVAYETLFLRKGEIKFIVPLEDESRQRGL